MSPADAAKPDEHSTAVSNPVLGLLWSVRPPEWIKNTFVFAAAIFSGQLASPGVLTASSLAFVSLCLAASATYLLNDVRDRRSDQLHPIKRHRPIAAGVVSSALAVGTALLAGVVGLSLAFGLNRQTGFVLIGYLALTTVYTLFLKRVVILDVLAVACGFVLRVILGAVAIGVEFSSWLILCTFMLALFLGFGKRRHELTLLEGNAAAHRAILGEYSPPFLDMMMAVVTSGAMMSYVLYTMDPATIAHFKTPNLVYTSVFVLYGVFRYLYLIHQKSFGGNPAATLYRDWSLLLSVLLWMTSVVLLRYF